METTLHENLRGPPQFRYVAAPGPAMLYSSGPMPKAPDLAYKGSAHLRSVGRLRAKRGHNALKFCSRGMCRAHVLLSDR